MIKIPEISSHLAGRIRYIEKEANSKDSKDNTNKKNEATKHNISL